ncbi:hypothetical protein KBY58_09775 [Cyanobium sp. HWJ4-Hawea]|uniref:hypothetical protein n=1 Tax=Cyanobium sp. HWJ4-Hawea TaxID=2823713 RepID=UPI0020CEAF2B|nr:hypothetical protein [Cyanobium sp. HWJ4-Hawea]MCP9809720.1 hypothetical protein [Cyanobium sp. HWJ4-Hawea]
MSRNPASDLIQFIAGGALFGSGGFLLANQVMASSAFAYRGGMGWGRYGGGGSMFPIGTQGMGLLMIPLGIGVCLMFAGAYKRWANLLVWASLAALVVGVLNSIRLTFIPTTLWALATYIVMIAAGGGLMFRSLRDVDGKGP